MSGFVSAAIGEDRQTDIRSRPAHRGDADMAIKVIGIPSRRTTGCRVVTCGIGVEGIQATDYRACIVGSMARDDAWGPMASIFELSKLHAFTFPKGRNLVLPLAVSAFLLLFSTSDLAQAQSFRQGVSAFNRQDYVSASHVFIPLAEQGEPCRHTRAGRTAGGLPGRPDARNREGSLSWNWRSAALSRWTLSRWSSRRDADSGFGSNHFAQDRFKS
jgi:hypothetical protein